MWSFVQTYVGCPNPCRRRAYGGALRGVCEATAAAAFPACARCILTTIVSREVHCVAQQKPPRGNYLLFASNKLKFNSYTIRCLRFHFA